MEWTAEQKAAAWRLLSEMEMMGDCPDPDEIVNEYQAWAAEHPEEAAALHERVSEGLRKALDRRLAR